MIDGPHHDKRRQHSLNTLHIERKFQHQYMPIFPLETVHGAALLGFGHTACQTDAGVPAA